MNSTPCSPGPKYHGVAVGVDSSPASRVAVDWAARDAVLRDVPLTVVHVMPSTVIGAGSAAGDL
jgi:nucleotide-binding universal stress UspA family protein